MAVETGGGAGVTGRADPRQPIHALLHGLLRFLGRVWVRHGAWIGLALLVAFFVAVMVVGWLRPVHAWDMVAYLAAAWKGDHATPQALHFAVWEAVRQGTDPDRLAMLSEGDAYRLRQYTDPLAFYSQIGMYEVKWLYVQLIRWIAPLTGAMHAAYAINIAAAAGFCPPASTPSRSSPASA